MFVNFSVMPLQDLDVDRLRAELLRRSSASPGWWRRRCHPRDAARLGVAAAAVLLLSGVQLMILGLIGEYLGRLYLTLNRKPQAVVREVVKSEPARAPAEVVTRRGV